MHRGAGPHGSGSGVIKRFNFPMRDIRFDENNRRVQNVREYNNHVFLLAYSRWPEDHTRDALILALNSTRENFRNMTTNMPNIPPRELRAMRRRLWDAYYDYNMSRRYEGRQTREERIHCILRNLKELLAGNGPNAALTTLARATEIVDAIFEDLPDDIRMGYLRFRVWQTDDDRRGDYQSLLDAFNQGAERRFNLIRDRLADGDYAAVALNAAAMEIINIIAPEEGVRRERMIDEITRASEAGEQKQRSRPPQLLQRLNMRRHQPV
jgi:hypothetical protein